MYICIYLLVFQILKGFHPFLPTKFLSSSPLYAEKQCKSKIQNVLITFLPGNIVSALDLDRVKTQTLWLSALQFHQS